MLDFPFTFTIPAPHHIPSRFDHHIQRQLSSLQGYFLDQEAYKSALSQANPIVYEVYELLRPEITGELLQGVSIIHPGKIGREFYMTKGHFHAVLDTSEVYYCLGGEGYMVMETPEGEARVEPISAGKVLFVPPRWAHRSVCTSRQQPLAIFFVYPAHSGHDYGTIETQGFRKLVVDGENGIEIIDNPHWKE
jgi:glucose-6-phosphate isomerase, archaeal